MASDTDKTISVVIEDAELTSLLERLDGFVANMSPVMHRIGALYEARVQENFRNQSAPDGTPWKPLAQDTMLMGLTKNKGWQKVRGGLSARGKRYLQGKRILIEAGDLMGSIHFQADAQSVTIGTGGSIPYAAIQQLGGKAGRGRKVTIPARTYLAMNRGEEMELAEVDRTWIMEEINRGLAGAA